MHIYFSKSLTLNWYVNLNLHIDFTIYFTCNRWHWSGSSPSWTLDVVIEMIARGGLCWRRLLEVIVEHVIAGGDCSQSWLSSKVVVEVDHWRWLLEHLADDDYCHHGWLLTMTNEWSYWKHWNEGESKMWKWSFLINV